MFNELHKITRKATIQQIANNRPMP